MLSTLKNIFMTVFNFDKQPPKTEENIDKIIEELSQNKNDTVDWELEKECQDENNSLCLLGQSKPAEIDVEVFKCSTKTGTVTYIGNDFGLLDNSVYFELNKVPEIIKLKEGDKVTYRSFKFKENESERVIDILSLVNEYWEDKLNTDEVNSNSKVEENLNALQRVINGIVTEKKGRKLLIEPIKLWFDLDKINATFVPIEGGNYNFLKYAFQ